MMQARAPCRTNHLRSTSARKRALARKSRKFGHYEQAIDEDQCGGISSSGEPTPNVEALPVDGSAAKCCPMFVASVQLTLDYDTLIEADSHNDDQQEDKNDYREDDGTTFYRDRPRSRKAASCGTFQISRDIRLSPQSGPKRTSVTI
jgi:hypothetical protein